MREIKFRGKAVMTGDWVYGSYLSYLAGKDTVHQIVSDGGMIMKVDPDTVGQFTNICSDDAVGVYEGQGIRLEGTVPGAEESFAGIVKFLECQYVVDNEKDCRPLWQEGVHITVLPEEDPVFELIGGDQ